MGDLRQLLAALSDDAGRRGQEFERICKWFLENDPVYAAELDRVWLWADWPGRWGADAGIDLVAKDRRGHLWAIQAKAYAPERSITKADLDTFLSESSRPDFSFRLLIGTTDLIGATARRTIDAQEKPVSLLLRSDLTRAPVNWPASPRALRAAKVPRKRPRPHQRTAIRDVVKGLSQHDRGKLVMACGTGKTLVSLFTAEKLHARRVLVLLPSLSLLSQTLTEWTANAAEPLEFLAVCSDDNVVDGDAVVASTSDLGLPVSTDPVEIARFLRGRGPGMKVVFSTYQSSPRVAEAMSRCRVPRFDLAIADEAHRCTGRVSSDFATILDNSLIRVRRRLFMTATPRYFTGRIIKEAQEADLEVASMDNEATFGPTLHRLTFAQAIEQDLLTDYQVAVIGVDDATYLDWARNGRMVTIDGTEVTDARTLAAQIGLAKALRKFDLRRTITFHSRVAAARRFSEELPGVVKWMPTRHRPKGTLTCDFVSGAMNAGIRNTRLQQLRDPDTDRAILSNARCLTEGIDVPSLDAIAFVDPRRSEVDIVQAVGRAIRKADDKRVGTIVIPVFIDSGQDPAASLNDSTFKSVWDVVNALRAHDDELAEELDDLRRQMGRSGRATVGLPRKLQFDLPTHVSRTFARAFRVELVERTTSPWEQWLGRLEHYVEDNGHAVPPSSFTTDDGFALGAWVNNRRAEYRRGQLRAELSEALERLPGWTWNARETAWDRGLDELTRFARAHGSANPLATYITDDGYALGPWAHRARQDYKRMTLRPDRISALESLPGWTWEPRDSAWQDGFDALCAHVRAHGTASPGAFTVAPDGFALGMWVVNKRQDRNVLPRARRKALEDLPGWTWNARQARWDRAYSVLAEYTRATGNSLPPRGYLTEHGFPLGDWVNATRSRGTRLSEERRAALEALPGWTWTVHDDKWDRGYAALVDYASENGHAMPPSGYKTADGYPLGTWVLNARSRSTRMTPARRSALEALPGWSWAVQEARWMRNYTALTLYVREYGQATPPATYVTSDGLRLGAWVGMQRTQRSTLPRHRVEALEDLSGWTWNSRDTRWQAGIAALLEYTEATGSASPPDDYITPRGFPLGSWVGTRRQEYRRGKIEPARVLELETLIGWTWSARDGQWQRGLEALKAYVNEHGLIRPTRGDQTADGFALGEWVKARRSEYQHGGMSEARASMLEQVPGWPF